MVTYFYLLLFSLFCATSTSLKLNGAFPKVKSSDSEFTSNLQKLEAEIRNYKLHDDIARMAKVKLGIMEHLTGSGYWNPQAYANDLTIQLKKEIGSKISTRVSNFRIKNASKSPPKILIKRNALSSSVPLDLGNKMLIFFVQDVLEPQEQ